MQSIRLVYSVIVLVLSLAFLIDCLVKRRKIAPLAKYGLICAAVLTGMQALMLLMLPVTKTIQQSILVGVLIVNFVQITLSVALGVYYSQKMRLPSMVTFGFVGSPRRSLDLKKKIGLCAAVLAGGLIYSTVLFLATEPTMSQQLSNMLQPGASSEISTPLLICVVVVAALVEELMYRLGIQNFLGHHLKDLFGSHNAQMGYNTAIVLTAALWAAAHTGILEPDWVKLVQIFPLGLALGYLYRRAGAEACMTTHAAFNFIMVFLGDYLIVQ
ncbi:CPBP family intramembrane metalloprotease [Planctomycetales bacterium ZRK34]|nr:CPBP family intramembrane metalloprotease [Planctomycetales bacterium ZRK34]